jgi:putative addiction module antidote
MRQSRQLCTRVLRSSFDHGLAIERCYLRQVTIWIIITPVTKLKIRSIGSSCGVILPKEILDRLHLGEGDELFAFEVGGQLRLSPYNPDYEKLMDAAREGVKKYRNALRALAKS